MKLDIRTPADVAAHFYSDSEDDAGNPLPLEELNRRLSRRVYKDTDCGAWAKVSERTVAIGTSKRRWTALLTEVGQSVRVEHARMEHGKKVSVAELPKVVRQYLCLGDDLSNDIMDIGETSAELIEGLERDHIPHAQVNRSPHQWRVHFHCDTPKAYKQVFVVEIGSIVEGTDAELHEETELPCSSEQLDAMVKAVEDAADEVWKDTHGCDQCGKGHAINPACIPSRPTTSSPSGRWSARTTWSSRCRRS
jgi:hypothetical protein